MFDEVAGVLEDIDTILAAVDVNAMVGDQPARALKVLRRHERTVACLRTRLTARAESMHQWRREGYSSFEDWYAATQGTSKGQARRRAANARKMRNRPDTTDALGKGEISEDQAEAIADAADKNPDAEKDLIGTAKNKGRSHKDLLDEAARAKASAEDDAAKARRLWRDRSARWCRDRDGHWALHAKLEPAVGAAAQTRLQAVLDRILGANRRAGNREERDRYAADALAEMLTGQARPVGDPDTVTDDGGAGPQAPGDTAEPSDPHRGSPATQDPAPAATATVATTEVPKAMVLDIDLEAYRRHQVLSGETCEIRGIGPVPVEVARQWADDAFIKAVIRDGTDIKGVVHFGRHIPEVLRTALEFRDKFCVVPSCNNPRIEFDHHQPHADHGPCSLLNLRGPCTPHHRRITHDGYQLEGGPGRWRWIAPDGTVLLADDPADLPQDARGP